MEYKKTSETVTIIEVQRIMFLSVVIMKVLSRLMYLLIRIAEITDPYSEKNKQI